MAILDFYRVACSLRRVVNGGRRDAAAPGDLHSLPTVPRDQDFDPVGRDSLELVPLGARLRGQRLRVLDAGEGFDFLDEFGTLALPLPRVWGKVSVRAGDLEHVLAIELTDGTTVLESHTGRGRLGNGLRVVGCNVDVGAVGVNLGGGHLGGDDCGGGEEPSSDEGGEEANGEKV